MKSITNLTDKCLIYLLTCKKYLIQYVDKTIDEFRFSWNNYKKNLEIMIVINHACNSIYLIINQVLVTVDS